MNAAALEERIGYHFREAALLTQAMTHSSYANEKRLAPHHDNERLEYLGDAVLELVTSDYLYHRYPEMAEGELTRKRASLVCEDALTEAAHALKLGEEVLLGKGEDRTGGRERKSVLSDACEALIGAVFLDGGLPPAAELIQRFVLREAAVTAKGPWKDHKTALQENVQGRGWGSATYRLVGEKGPAHRREFTAEAIVLGKVLGTGTGGSKKAAEQEAARMALEELDKEK